MPTLFRPVPGGVLGSDVIAAEHRRRGRLLARSTKCKNVENVVERGQRLHPAQGGVLQLGPVRPEFVRVVVSVAVVVVVVGDVVAEPRLEDPG